MKRRLGWALVGIAVMCFLLLGIVTIARTTTVVELIRSDQTKNAERSEDIKDLAEQIESCTTPSGDCYRQSQSRTGAAVGTINQITVYAAACASTPNTLAAPTVERRIELITACVQASLESNAKP